MSDIAQMTTGQKAQRKRRIRGVRGMFGFTAQGMISLLREAQQSIARKEFKLRKREKRRQKAIAMRDRRIAQLGATEAEG